MPTEFIEIEIPNRPLPDLVTWLPIEGKKVDFASLTWQGRSEKLMCTHPKNHAILDTMIEMISSAKHSVFLFNWMLNHPRIEKSLIDAAKRLNGRVHVLTTLGTSIFSRYSDEEQAKKDLTRLQNRAGNGVYIRLHPESHAKFLIVDDELLITSANIVKTSLDRILRQEFVLVIQLQFTLYTHFSHTSGSMRQINIFVLVRKIKDLAIHGPNQIIPRHRLLLKKQFGHYTTGE